MTLDEMIQEVYNLTNRPDLVAATKSAVKAATVKAHITDFYSKDIAETGVAFEEPAYIHSLDYNSVIPRFRSLKYFRRVKDENDREGVFLEVVTPEEVLDAYSQGRTDICYVAGNILEMRASVEFSKALMGAYVYPNVTDLHYSSWIADNHTFAIVYEAARVIFKTIGYDEEAATYNQLVAEEYNLLRMTALSDVGY